MPMITAHSISNDLQPDPGMDLLVNNRLLSMFIGQILRG
jgi:hypothetical protein